MKASQKQWQLYYLGFYGESVGDIDGDFGPKSKAGTEDFQKTFGLEPADGIFGRHTRNKSKEIISAIQEVLQSYAKEAITVDGLAGPRTMDATRAFQKAVGLAPTGIADPETREAIAAHEPHAKAPEEQKADWWKEIRYFTREEWRCKCGKCGGFPAEPEEKLVRRADSLRQTLGAAVTVSSGVRCSDHNRKVGGVSGSRHLSGKAMDFCAAGKTSRQVLACIQKMDGIRYAYAIDGRYVHMDIA